MRKHLRKAKSIFKKPLFWSAFVIFAAILIFVSSVDLKSLAQTPPTGPVFGSGTPHFLAKWVDTTCVDKTWSPDPSTVCLGQQFTQTSNCGRTQSATGTKNDGSCIATPTLTISPSSASIIAGGTKQFYAYYDPDGSGPQVTQQINAQATWSSDNMPVATVNAGLATGISSGTAHITVSYNNLTAQANLTVSSVTYNWSVGGWGACVNGVQTRSVYCKDSNGSTVNDSYCSGVKPVDSQGCNQSPQAINLTQNVSGGTLQPDCTLQPNVTLGWTFSDADAGNTQTAYQVQVSSSASFPSSTTNTYSTGATNSGNNYSLVISDLSQGAYYWRVKVKDSSGASNAWSGWAGDINNKFNIGASGKAVSFVWAPKPAYINNLLTFTPSSSLNILNYAWTFPGGTPASSSAQNPSGIKFTTAGTKAIQLGITTTDHQSCSIVETLTIATVIQI